MRANHKLKADINKLNFISYMKWFENFEQDMSIKEKTYDEYFGKLQIFHSNSFMIDLVEKKLHEHKLEILRAVIYGKRGFLEKMNRLPNKKDKVKFVICADDDKGRRFLRIDKYKDEYGDPVARILSDCRLEIVEAE